LAECSCAAAHEKSTHEPGRVPETFHDSGELTNSIAVVQQNVRECHRWEPQIAWAFALPGAWSIWAKMSQRFLLTGSCEGG
jgi:hypothetical protein